ncbi:MAG: hypothetical protein DRP95_00455 [Candidatus Latescibacterota bacterium]|nr:MAG: hypothetical protein DRP95_00455 [Candidatus Latescibacterota bacterium]
MVYPIPGHLGLSLLGNRCLKARLFPVVLAGFAPDVVDKALSWFVHATPYGRSFMHSLTGLVVCTVLAVLVKGRVWGYSWAVGHMAHLIGDISFIPWFYPFVRYTFPQEVNFLQPENLPRLWNPIPLVLETSLLLLVLVSYAKSVRDRWTRFVPLGLAAIVAGFRLWVR